METDFLVFCVYAVIDCNVVRSMKYMDAAIWENLWLFPPLNLINHRASEDYDLGSTGIFCMYIHSDHLSLSVSPSLCLCLSLSLSLSLCLSLSLSLSLYFLLIHDLSVSVGFSFSLVSRTLSLSLRL